MNIPRWRSRNALAGFLILALMLPALGACATTPRASAARAQSTARPPASPTAHGNAQHTFTYVALGASDAYGIGTDDPDKQNWPTVLANQLGSSVHLINLGIPGATVRLAQQAELPVAVSSSPDVVTVWLAVNDYTDGMPLATYRQQLSTLLSTLRTQTHARVFVGNLPNLTLLPYFDGRDSTQLLADVRAWNDAISQVAAQQDAAVVDLYSGWSELATHPDYLASDGLHPSTLGARRLAQVFYASIQSAHVYP